MADHDEQWHWPAEAAEAARARPEPNPAAAADERLSDLLVNPTIERVPVGGIAGVSETMAAVAVRLDVGGKRVEILESHGGTDPYLHLQPGTVLLGWRVADDAAMLRRVRAALAVSPLGPVLMVSLLASLTTDPLTIGAAAVFGVLLSWAILVRARPYLVRSTMRTGRWRTIRVGAWAALVDRGRAMISDGATSYEVVSMLLAVAFDEDVDDVV